MKNKVLYIAGTGRCGSTILDMVLGQLPGATSVGELRYLWKRGVGENRLCGTGEPFTENTQWKNIVEALYGDDLHTKASEFSALESSLRIRAMLGLKTQIKLNILRSNVSPYAKELRRVLGAIQNEFKSNLIIDSSKMPMHGFALAQIPDIDLRVIHLVRDRKAVVHSWNTAKFDKGKDGMMNAQSVRKASIEWELINRWIVRYLGDGSVPYKKVSYAKFTEDPVNTVNDIIDFLDENTDLNPVGIDKGLDILPTPSISGNPMRFCRGHTMIKEDVRWKTDMPYRKRLLSDVYAAGIKSLFFL